MRIPLVLAALFILPMAAAQEPVAEDPQGDVVMRLAGQEVPWPGPRWGAADLLSLTITEDATEVTFTIQVADLEGATEDIPLLDNILYEVLFTFGGESYRLSALRANTPQGRDYASYLWLERDASFEALAPVFVAADEASDTLTLPVPRDLLRDSRGAVLVGGLRLQDVHAAAANQNPSAETGRVGDRLPDADALEWLSRFGPDQTGHLRLSSPNPIRVSNGAAATYQFDIHVENVGDSPANLQWQLEDSPEAWATFLPSETMIASGETRTVPVLVSVPFAHQHGSLETAVLEVLDTEDPEGPGRLQIGIHYTSTPQPAGHHDTLFIHSTDVFGQPRAYMNALPEDPGDSATPVPGSAPIGDGTFVWEVPLQPVLGLGLETDPDRAGRFAATFATQVLTTPFDVSGRLVLRGVEDRVLATLPQVSYEPATMGDEYAYEVDFRFDENQTRFPHEPGSNLVLLLQADLLFGYAVLQEIGLVMLPGATLNLPLHEYYEDVTSGFQELGGLSLSVDGSQTLRLPPGSTGQFAATVAGGDSGADVEFQLLTGFPEWLAWQKRQITLGPDGTAEVLLTVAVPADAADGTRGDITLVAEDVQTGQQSLTNLVVIVDAAAEPPAAPRSDESGPDEVSTPASSLWVLLLGLLAISVTTRRHRRA